MFIKYNNTNLHALGSFDGKQISWLRPGWNEFPSALFKLYEKDPEILKMIEDKKIELLNEKVSQVKGKKKVTLHIGMSDEPIHTTDLPERKAIEIIKGTYNRDILQRWEDEETRHKVKRAIAEQVKPLLPESQAS